ncbi:MAG: hypothetical protein IJ080_06695 [Oscillospiraceae bacterium]|nr:hypothetical protein [Oscillospiraceae bacterium]
MKRIISALMIAALVLTGCSSYKAGTVKDGVYSNGIFSVTTPDGFVSYTGDDTAKVTHYIVCYNKAQKRGAEAFKCEYAATGGTSDIIVASEQDSSITTASDLADIIAKQMEGDILGYSVAENKDVTVDGVPFRKIAFSSSGGNITYYITQKDKTFVYVYILTLDHDFTGAGDKALDCIGAP